MPVNRHYLGYRSKWNPIRILSGSYHCIITDEPLIFDYIFSLSRCSKVEEDFMKTSLLRLATITILLFGALGTGEFAIFTQNADAAPQSILSNNHCSCLHNALEKKVITAYGSWTYINWTNPNLNGGQWSYHRTGVTQSSPWRYVEFGWQKWTSNAARVLLAYNDGTGPHNVSLGSISLATHRYSMQYNSSTGKYDFFYDGNNI